MIRLKPQSPPSDPRYRSPAREIANGFFWLLFFVVVIAAALYLAGELPGLLGGAMKE